MSDPQALHAELLAKISTEWEVWAPSPAAEPLGQIRIAAREVLKLHKPRPWRDTHLCRSCGEEGGIYPCQTVKVIAAALGVSTDG